MFLWDIYARVYDSLNIFSPYLDLMEEVLSYLNPKEEEKILEAGCGTGNYTSQLEKSLLYACDYSECMLKRAKNKNKKAIFEKVDLNAELPYQTMFDKILCINVIYALNNPQELAEKFAKIIKPNGYIVIVNPVKLNLLEMLVEHFKKIDTNILINTIINIPSILLLIFLNALIVKKAVKQDYHFFSEDELQTIFSKAGFRYFYVKKVYLNNAILFIASKENDLKKILKKEKFNLNKQLLFKNSIRIGNYILI